MKKIFNQLYQKIFSVYVDGEFERKTNIWGFIRLLKNYSDVFEYTEKEAKKYFNDGLKKKYFYIDANIYVKTN